MVTLSSCLIWQIISFILLPNEYGGVYAWTTLGNIATWRMIEWMMRMKIIFSDEAHFHLGGYVNSQNCRLWGTKKTRTHSFKSRHTQNESLFVADFGPESQLCNFSSKMSKEMSLQSMAIVFVVEWIFVHKNCRGGYWQHLVSTGRRYVPHATVDVLSLAVEDRIISRRCDVVWPPRSCDFTPLDYYLCSAVKDKCYPLKIGPIV